MGSPLIMLWTTAEEPLATALNDRLSYLLHGGAGSLDGGLIYVHVRLDLALVPDPTLDGKYPVPSLPMLLAFDQSGMPLHDTILTDIDLLLTDLEFVDDWLQNEARPEY